MAALSAYRNTKQYGLPPGGTVPETLVFDVAATVTVYKGSLVTIDSSGNANPSAAALSGICAGRCDGGTGDAATTGGASASSAETVNVREGVFLWDISGALTKSSFGAYVWCYDDHTVTPTVENTVAGVFVGLDSLTGSMAMVATYWGPNPMVLAPKSLKLGAGGTVLTSAKVGAEQTLVAGTVTVADTAVTAASIILLSRVSANASTALGALTIGTITAGTSFVVTSLEQATPASTQTGDVSKFMYALIN